MDGAAGWIAGHGYLAVSVVLLLASFGVPVILTMVLAGAATALERNESVLTHNVRHFVLVPGLNVIQAI